MVGESAHAVRCFPSSGARRPGISGLRRELCPRSRSADRRVRACAARRGRVVARSRSAAEPRLRAGPDIGRTLGEWRDLGRHRAVFWSGSAAASAPSRGIGGGAARRQLHRLDRNRIGEEPDLSRADLRHDPARRSGASQRAGADRLPDERADQQPDRGAQRFPRRQLAREPGAVRAIPARLARKCVSSFSRIRRTSCSQTT